MACTAAHHTHRDQPWYSSIIIEVALMLGWVFMCPHRSCSATKQAATYDVLDYSSGYRPEPTSANSCSQLRTHLVWPLRATAYSPT